MGSADKFDQVSQDIFDKPILYALLKPVLPST